MDKEIEFDGKKYKIDEILEPVKQSLTSTRDEREREYIIRKRLREMGLHLCPLFELSYEYEKDKGDTDGK